MFQCQTRNHEGATIQHATVAEGFKAAEKDQTIWKISWTNDVTNERIRLVRQNRGPQFVWVYEPMPLFEETPL